jgi:hypothetical protein
MKDAIKIELSKGGDNMKVAELKAILEELELTDYSEMKKQELVELLREEWYDTVKTYFKV